MRANHLKSCAGFTFIAALMIVIVMGIMLGATAQVWQTVMKRDREEELLFRGSQIRDAVMKWRKPRPGRQVFPIGDLKELLEDPHSPDKARYLRRLYKDPITNQDFEVIKDPALGIIGVASTSRETPLKQANFPDEFKEFGGKASYSDWQFVFKPGRPQPGQLRVNLPPIPPPPPL